MITKRILNKNRIRTPEKGFSFIPHRFLREGFFQILTREETLLYFFLVLASDKNGVSFYSYESICNILGFEAWEYLEARSALICFDKNLYQVISLPSHPVRGEIKQGEDPVTVRNMIIESLREEKNG